jgi:hypothetical protein
VTRIFALWNTTSVINIVSLSSHGLSKNPFICGIA